MRRFAPDLATILVLALAAGGLWAFLELGDAVGEGDWTGFDSAVMLALRAQDDLSDPVGPHWVEIAMRDVTGLGGVALLTLVVIGGAIWLWLRRDAGTALYLVAATGLGMLLSPLFKTLYDRPRPDLVPHGTLVSSASFPSGHTLMATVVWLTLGLLVARRVERRRERGFVLTIAVCIALAVGISRVYLGVHWPTDVLAGWALGAVWALLWAQGARLLARRGRLRGAEGGD
ncbi:phosphatase PAP2 family protein [Wenxinia saemankumensis]|uniref:Undecaprenyl-diphosphatase n=1 Tax=Wenxinia saemankumensis TaxID=1447782 RepID=A0A1M6E467_9RHOB|nr:phosphatase PAP2 family protein [Wenxinia saemankumensis]SHI80286.1 undecaprenyl-diphosphatase [Wenxinia saemankumensis]